MSEQTRELIERVEQLEREVAELRKRLAAQPAPESPTLTTSRTSAPKGK